MGSRSTPCSVDRCRSVRAYTWLGPCNSPETPVRVREGNGSTAFKTDPFSDFVTIGKRELRYFERCMTALKGAVGPDLDVAVDGHWRFLARLRNAPHIPLAIGERHNTRWEDGSCCGSDESM